MRAKHWFTIAGLICVLASVAGYGLSVRQGGDMAQVQAWVRQSHPTVDHIDKATFDAMAARGDVLALDVRTAAEYAVSHKAEAVHVEPDISADDFIARHGEAIRGKVLLVYCSVGKRSSHLAERLGETMMQHGAAGVFNIEGGIFGWHNDFRPLKRRMNPTQYVHPFNEEWARYLKRRELTRYTPEE
jgi:rhodanese-related sulfurtransferase